MLISDEQALGCCLLARQHEERGDYEAAAMALKQWWEVGEEPQIDALDLHAKAHVLLRAGTVYGWLGSAEQIAGAQKVAQGLLQSSMTLFKLINEETHAVEAQIESAYCYWREGAFDLARTNLRAALNRLPDTEGDLRLNALVRSAVVEQTSKHLHEAFNLLILAQPLAKASRNHSLKGRFYTELATTLKNIGLEEQRGDYTNRALFEFAAASFHFEQVGHTRNRAVIENNIGFLLLTLGQYKSAHVRLERACELATRLQDRVLTAQFDETRAQLFLAEQRYTEAEGVIQGAVTTLEQGGQLALLAEALTTQGVVLARLGRCSEARNVLDRARHTAERCGDTEGAGRAALTLIEELCDQVSNDDRREVCTRADQLLAYSQHTATRERLTACQHRVADAHAAHEGARVEEQERIRRAAFHDSLTGLANRALLNEHLRVAINHSKRDQTHLFAVLLLDLDRFKTVNDSLGHVLGDQLLVATSRRLETTLRPQDVIARQGGDEFTILLNGIDSIKDAIRVAKRIHDELRQPFRLDGHDVFTTASIGIALSTQDYTRTEEVLRDADTAMYRAKTSGRGHHKIFDPKMHERAMALLKLETDLRLAVEREEFCLHYQPIISLENNRIIGFEALVRWQHPERGLVLPDDFIPIAEETGLIGPIGHWVLHEACRQLRQWQEHSRHDLSLSVNVNLSGKQFSQVDLVERIKSVLEQTGLSARSLKLEITESTVMEKAEAAAVMLEQIRNLGVEVHIDDFGTGYSSLSYLHRFPIDVLKIDRSFVSRMGPDGENSEIVRTIVQLAHNLGMKVAAEGVMTAEQLGKLRALGCDYGQGYFFSEPLDSERAKRIIAT